ncbi:hypothetical protein FQA39_LY00773 [Lamprigera yunnana]|nr:hypothetical protein FQA39_LY00773 [Lamprigera yunnana]
MDVDCNESFPIKKEVVVEETFSFCPKFGDFGNAKLKSEPIDCEELFKCTEEEELSEHIDLHAAAVQQYACNECNFQTMDKNSLIEQLKTTKNVEYFYKECNFKTPLECSIKEHLKIHNKVCARCNVKKLIFQSTSQLKTQSGNENICSKCNYDTWNKPNPKKNMKIYTNNECNYKTIQESNLKTHMKIHMGDVYKCNQCKYTTVQERCLKAHMKIHTGGEYKCKKCEYKTVWERSLKAHIKIHMGDEYKCTECEYKTVWKSNLKAHTKTHLGDEYKCTECEYKTIHERTLKAHMKIHMGNEYKCKECEYKTVWKSNLKVHMKNHIGDEYKCKECEYKTVRKGNLKTHLKIHMGDTYKCKDCEYRTVWESNLKVHMKMHTGDEYKCEKCEYKTVWEQSLKAHMKNHMGEEYKCKDCDYKTVLEHSIKSHIKIHKGDEYKCEECDYKTVWKSNLKAHIKNHMGDKYKCNECEFETVHELTLKAHIKIHLGNEYKYCVSNFVLREFTKGFTIYYVHEGTQSITIPHINKNPYVIVNIKKPIIGRQHYQKYYILQTADETSFIKMFFKLQQSKIWDFYTSSKAKFLIIATTSTNMFDILWPRGIMYSTLFHYGDKVLTCDPYHNSNKCGRKCINSIWNQCTSKTFYHKSENRSFQNCSINFITPYADDNVQSQNIITRFILEELKKYLGVSIKIMDRKNYRSRNGNLQLYLTDTTFFISYTTNPIFTDNFGWVTFVSKTPSTLILQYTFERNVWIMIGVTFISISLIWCLTIKFTANKWSVFPSFINVLALALVGCMPNIPQPRPLKCLISFYLVFVIIMHAAFKTNLAKILTVDQYDSSIKNLADLSDSDQPVCTHRSFINFFYAMKDADIIYTKIKKRIRPIDNWNDVLKYRNCTYLMLEQDIYILKNQGNYKMEYFIDNALTSDMKYSFYFTRDNYLSEILNRLIKRFVENGISEHIISENNRRQYGNHTLKDEKWKPKVLTMDHMYGIFVIWAVGIAISIIVFLVEVLSIKFVTK